MKPAELKALYEQNHIEGHFFDNKTMKFFGDKMSNYGVRDSIIKTSSAEKVECWELFRKKAVKHGLTNSAFFRKPDARQIFGVRA